MSRFHQIQCVSVDNSAVSKTAMALAGTPCRASVLFLLLHGGDMLLQIAIIII